MTTLAEIFANSLITFNDQMEMKEEVYAHYKEMNLLVDQRNINGNAALKFKDNSILVLELDGSLMIVPPEKSKHFLLGAILNDIKKDPEAMRERMKEFSLDELKQLLKSVMP